MTSVRRAFPGTHDQVARARAFVRDIIEGCPLADEAALLTSELCTNALQHTKSGNGGTFEVAVNYRPGSLRIEVRDAGSAGMPAPQSVDGSSENGRGLEIVSHLAHRWGHHADAHGRSVYFELRWDCPAAPREIGGRQRPRPGERRCRTAHAATANTRPVTACARAPGPPSPGMRCLFRNLQALGDAIAYRRARITAQCPDCREDARCDDHGQDVALIAEYHQDATVVIETMTALQHGRADRR